MKFIKRATMTKYIYQQTILQYRIPIKEDGKLGHPEIVKKFTTDIKGASQYKKKKKKVKELTTDSIEEVEF
jgi:hypothetical protein